MGLKTVHRHKGVVVLNMGSGTGEFQVMPVLYRHVNIPVRIQHVHRPDFGKAVLFRHGVISFRRIAGRSEAVGIHKCALRLLHQFRHQYRIQVLFPFGAKRDLYGDLAFLFLSQRLVHFHQAAG